MKNLPSEIQFLIIIAVAGLGFAALDAVKEFAKHPPSTCHCQQPAK